MQFPLKQFIPHHHKEETSMETELTTKGGSAGSMEITEQPPHQVKAVGEAFGKASEIRFAIEMARALPRDESAAFFKLMKASGRPSFAEDASYSFPRGDAKVTGPSVNIAREAARVWGNVRYGLEVLRDDAASRHIRGWAWDLETNTKVEAEDEFKKLIQRRVKGGETVWIACDERDLRELTNRRGAILVRNCLLQIMPKDLIEDALFQCAETLKNTAAKDPDAARKRLTVDFMAFNVTPEMMAEVIGCPLSSASPEQMTELRQTFNSIKDGHSTWREYASKGDEEKKPLESKAAETQPDKGQSVRDKIKSPPAEKTAAEPKPKKENVPATIDQRVADFLIQIGDAQTAAAIESVMKKVDDPNQNLSMIQKEQVETAAFERNKVLTAAASAPNTKKHR